MRSKALSALLALVWAGGLAAQAAPPSPDPRIGLRAGVADAAVALWNMEVLSETPPPAGFEQGVNSDLAFTGPYTIQGNFNGFQVWDLTSPREPILAASHVCPASQSDVSVYKHLLFVSGEGMEGRLDCAAGGNQERVSAQRLRGIRIFDISNVKAARYVGNVQTCRGSHTHSVLVDPKDPDNVYVYVSGSAPVRPAEELPGCSGLSPDQDPSSALFRIEVIKVPLASPERAAIVTSPRIFTNLVAPPEHGLGPEDLAALERAKAAGAFVVDVHGEDVVLGPNFTAPHLAKVVQDRGGTGPATAADSATLRGLLPAIIAEIVGPPPEANAGPAPGPTQCHDITLYPALGLAGGACEGYGMLIDISDPTNPRRLSAVADSNFAYWHSATFNNDGTKILFSDEWGGGGSPKCRSTDPKAWGANAIFTIENGEMTFASYYKLPAAQTALENCVAHNGSLIPIPGRDVMVQSWYQGGLSVFDFTDAANPHEIAFFDRGPLDATRFSMAGSWSAYWYNGVIVSSEIARGLDVLGLTPSPHISQNELDAAKTVRFDHFNVQGQQRFTWPPSFSLARAYLDQLERSGGLAADRIATARSDLAAAERATGNARRNALNRLATRLEGEAGSAREGAKVRLVAAAARELRAAQ